MEPPSNFKSISLHSGELSVDLYTIPSHSCWFSWDSIHDTERSELREFFDGSSFTRSPKVYKEYRDFIISKYREDPSRRLNFTEVRKSLVGDVCVLRKVFNFLDKWGLINFSAVAETVVEEEGDRVRVEEGAPIGVRVVGAPNSSKGLVVPGGAEGGSAGGAVYGFKLPPLASHSDVFGEVESGKEVSCVSCKEKCDSKYYECTKEEYTVCLKCFEKGLYGENKSKDDFKLNDSGRSNGCEGAVWTEAETLLLLESVLKHGDDWDLVVQSVQTKTKLECISRLIELPFGELMLGSHGKVSSKGTIKEVDVVQEQRDSSEPQETMKQEESDNHHEENGKFQEKNDGHQEENGEQQQKNDQQLEILERENSVEIPSLEPPTKKKRVDSSDPNRSLIEQVALISTMVGPHITATAASAAVTVLSDGNPLVREIFYTEDDVSEYKPRSGNLNNELERALQSDDAEMEDASHSSEIVKLPSVKDSIPLALRMRAAVGTALGAAAAHARLLADQEERELEHLMSFIVETQMKKVQCKANYLDTLESLMEKEHAILEESKESIVEERIETLQRIFASGISRWKDQSSQKTPNAGL